MSFSIFYDVSLGSYQMCTILHNGTTLLKNQRTWRHWQCLCMCSVRVRCVVCFMCVCIVCVLCLCACCVLLCVRVCCVCACVCASVFLTNIKKQTSYRKSVLFLTSLETPASLCHAQQTSAWTRKLFPSPVYAQWSGSFLRSSNWHDWRTLAWKLKFFS